MSLTHKPETLLYCILSLSESVTLYKAWVFEWLSVALKHPEHQHQDPVETDFLTCVSNKQVQNKSLFPLSYPSGGPGGRVNGGHSRAPKKSATLLSEEDCSRLRLSWGLGSGAGQNI